MPKQFTREIMAMFDSLDDEGQERFLQLVRSYVAGLRSGSASANSGARDRSSMKKRFLRSSSESESTKK